MQAYGVGEELAEALRGLGLAHLLQRLARQLVIAAGAHRLGPPVAQVERHALPAAQLPCIREQGLFSVVGEADVEIVDRALEVQAAAEAGQLEQLLDLGPERDAARRDEVVERFDAEAVAGGEQPLPL